MERPECFWCGAHLCPDGTCPNGCRTMSEAEYWQLEGPQGDVPEATWEALREAMRGGKRD